MPSHSLVSSYVSWAALNAAVPSELQDRKGSLKATRDSVVNAAAAPPLTYAAVLARSATKHVRAGKAASAADVAAMQELADRVSRATVQINEVSAAVDAGASDTSFALTETQCACSLPALSALRRACCLA